MVPVCSARQEYSGSVPSYSFLKGFRFFSTRCIYHALRSECGGLQGHYLPSVPAHGAEHTCRACHFKRSCAISGIFGNFRTSSQLLQSRALPVLPVPLPTTEYPSVGRITREYVFPRAVYTLQHNLAARHPGSTAAVVAMLQDNVLGYHTVVTSSGTRPLVYCVPRR